MIVKCSSCGRSFKNDLLNPGELSDGFKPVCNECFEKDEETLYSFKSVLLMVISAAILAGFVGFVGG